MSLIKNVEQTLPRHADSSVFAPYSAKFYRNDIQGVRALSAIMIMVYHIWLSRVSGGVDVFFVISGFLVTTTLLRGLSGTGRISPVGFWARICRRVFPSAYTVLIATLLLSLIFVPVPLWKYGINEFTASAAHLENLELIRMGTDYLDREAPPSQFQQFWALSIQMQFYLALPFVIMGLAFFARRLRTIQPLVWGVSVLLAVSLAFSVIYTSTAPSAAYFHPGTRAWEFLAGSLVAIVYPFLRASRGKAAAYVWNGLTITAGLALLLLGLFVGPGVQFPGLIAGIPVLAAVMLLVAGKADVSVPLVNRLLATRFLVYLGGFSFTIYLWHWPILVFAQHQLQTTTLSLTHGLLVILLSVGLAAVTKRFVEEPILRTRITKPISTLLKQVGVAIAVVALGVASRQGVIHLASTQLGQETSAHIAEPLRLQDEVDIPLEYFVVVDYDRPEGIDCLSGRHCIGGDKNAERTITMVGDSHAAQWYDVMDSFGAEHGFRVITRFNVSDIAGAVQETAPDVVVTTSTRTPVSATGEEESTSNRIGELIGLAEQGTPVVGIRDNPRFDFYQNACVWRNRDSAQECALNRAGVFASANPADQYEQASVNFHSVDLSRLFCADTVCPAVTQDTFVYYDRHHFSDSYLDLIDEAVISQLLQQAPGAFSSD